MPRSELSHTSVANGAGKYSGRVLVDSTLVAEGEGTARWVHRDHDVTGHGGLTIVRYSGGWSEGVRHGDGEWRTSAGTSYTGKYVCEQRCGEGRAEFQAGSTMATVTGTFVNGMPHGQGVAVSGTAKYTGEFVAGKWHGEGTVEYPDGSVFRGTFADGFREGHGRFEWADGEVYDGGYSRDLRSGVGVYTWPDGRRYEGEFADDHRHGHGKLFFSDGGLFEGEYHMGQRQGDGTMTYADKLVDSGEWKGNMLVKLAGGGKEASNGPLTKAGREYLVAVKNNDAVAIRSALHTGTIFVDLADEEGKTSLYHATLAGFTDIVRLLLSLGARPNYLTQSGVSILRAAYSTLPSVLEPAIWRGPLDPSTFTPHERNVRASIQVLLDSGASPNADANPSATEKTVLFTAIRATDIEMTVGLIKRGTDVNFAGLDGVTPLHVALHRVGYFSNLLSVLNVWRRRAKLRPALFNEVDEERQRFQTPNFRRRSQVVVDKCVLGMTAIEIVGILLDAGAVADEVTDSGDSALHIAAQIKGTLFDSGVVSKLAARCSKLNHKASGTTALYSAIVARNYTLAEHLLDLGADPNVRLDDGRAALCAVVAAVPHTEDECVLIEGVLHHLVKAGADPLIELWLDKICPGEKAGVANLIDYAAMATRKESRPVPEDGPAHALMRPALPDGCTLTASTVEKFQASILALTVEYMREKNKGRTPLVPMCYECGFRLGYGRAQFRLHKWGGAHFCSEQCKMRKQNRSRSTAVCWDPASRQGQRAGSDEPAIMSTRLKSAPPSRSRVQKEGSTIRPMPLK